MKVSWKSTLYCTLVWKPFAFQKWEIGCGRKRCHGFHCHGFRLSTWSKEGTANPACNVSPAEDPPAGEWKCRFSWWPVSSAKGHRHPADLLPSVPCPSSSLCRVGQGRRARESPLTAGTSTAAAAGTATGPTADPGQACGHGHLPARRPRKGQCAGTRELLAIN